MAEAVYERVKTDIFDFRLMPGARFSENEIARRARVSRTPVREALLRLEREGYLDLNAKSGWAVRPLDFQHFEHLYDVRIVLELAVVKKLCSAEFGDALADLEKAWLLPPGRRLKDWLRVARLDEAFHSALVAAAGNPELSRIHTSITERIRIIRRLDFTQPERIERTYEEHAGILRAVIARKAQQAALLLKSHIEQSKLEVRKISLHRLHVAHQQSQERI